MPEFRHPRALDSVRGYPPSRVHLTKREKPRIRDGTFETDNERAVERVAASYGLTLEDLRVSQTCDVVKNDGEVCGRQTPCPYHD